MDVYFDKNFVLNYWDLAKNESPYLNFENEFLKHADLYTIITNFGSIDEILSSDEANYFFFELIDTDKEIVFQPDLTEETHLTSCFENGGLKIFFLELSDFKIRNFEEKYGYRIISTKHFSEQWKIFENCRIIEKTITTPINETDYDVFNSWKDLRFLSQFPTNSIIISDKYILSDKSNNRIKDNLIPLLHTLIPQFYKGTLYITIISEKILCNRNLKTFEKAQKIYKMLNREFARYNHIKFKFSIIGYIKELNDGNQPEIHDRHIYTNYFTIKSGSGFDLFYNGKRKIKDSEIVISFNFQKFLMKSSTSKIIGLINYLLRLQEVERFDTFKYYPEKIENCLLER